MATKEIKDYWSRVAALGCMITGNTPEIHHCKSGSMSQHGIHTTAKKKPSDWLVIPLSPDYHRGKYGVHQGVKTWESKHLTQIEYLILVSNLLGVDVFKNAGYRFNKELERYEKI